MVSFPAVPFPSFSLYTFSVSCRVDVLDRSVRPLPVLSESTLGNQFSQNCFLENEDLFSETILEGKLFFFLSIQFLENERKIFGAKIFSSFFIGLGINPPPSKEVNTQLASFLAVSLVGFGDR